MKQKYIVLLTILITLVIVVGGFFAWQYELKRNQSTYDKGYNSGKLEGLLYTQQTGRVVILENGNPSEFTIEQICNNINQQQVVE